MLTRHYIDGINTARVITAGGRMELPKSLCHHRWNSATSTVSEVLWSIVVIHPEDNVRCIRIRFSKACPSFTRLRYEEEKRRLSISCGRKIDQTNYAKRGKSYDMRYSATFVMIFDSQSDLYLCPNKNNNNTPTVNI